MTILHNTHILHTYYIHMKLFYDLKWEWYMILNLDNYYLISLLLGDDIVEGSRRR